ncbi:sul1_32_EF592571 [Klebsiella pneumoniae]|nr:sul1_32_EF592571 [Klebsiella pneumoniae]
MVTVFGILNLTEDSFLMRPALNPPALSPAAIKCCPSRINVVDAGPAASHQTRGLYRQPMRSDVLRRS